VEALEYPYSPSEQARIERGRDRLHVGSPATLRPHLTALAESVQADELMIVTAIPDQAARRDSYRLLAA